LGQIPDPESPHRLAIGGCGLEISQLGVKPGVDPPIKDSFLHSPRIGKSSGYTDFFGEKDGFP